MCDSNDVLREALGKGGLGECIPVTEENMKPSPAKSYDTGWICPLCGRVNAPSVVQCPCRGGHVPYPWPYYPHDPVVTITYY